MRKWLLFGISLLFLEPGRAQSGLEVLLLSGLEDTRTFANDFLRPGTEAVMYNLSNGWYHTAEVKKPLGFEFSMVGNVSLHLSDHQSFFLETDDYQNLEFTDGSLRKEVATIFGRNDTGIEVRSFYENSSGSQQASIFELPAGIGDSEINYLPLVFVQARLGLFMGTEVKARYFPRINYNNVEAELYGAALQHEITSWFSNSIFFPLAISGLVGYTEMRGKYNFTDQNYIEGENQVLRASMSSWILSVMVSTKIPVFNVYGGIGYAGGRSETDMTGTYVVNDPDSGMEIFIVEDPVSVVHDIRGIVGSLGASFKLGVLKLSADYNFQEYEAVKVGLHLGF